MIYEHLISRGKLQPHHLDSLKNRGFTDDLIKSGRFISSGQYIRDIDFPGYTLQQIIDSHIGIPKGDSWEINPQLLQDNIIIPYLTKEGKCSNIRPHKYQLSGNYLKIYHENSVGQSVILTEGEFKAHACRAWGINAISIPGIGTYCGEKFDELKSFLELHQVKDVLIVFDNEIKNDPRFPNFKEKPEHRWDTQYYAYLLASLLRQISTITVKIGVLPIQHAINGKIDIDGLLAQGKKLELATYDTHHDYLKSLPPEAQFVIKRKEKKRFFHSHISVDFNRYLAKRKKDILDPISNFIIKILNTYDTPEGIVREVQFINEYGQSSKPFFIQKNEMARDFSEFCYSCGNFVWKGTREDLSILWEWLFIDDEGRFIIEPDHIGWVKSENLWLFENMALHNGVIHNKSNIFWVGERGIKPLPIASTTGKTNISGGLAHISTEAIDTNAIYTNLSETIGKTEAGIALGWCAAVLHMETVFAKYGCFPFLFVSGRRGSGKTTICEWLMSLYGIDSPAHGVLDSTIVGIQRYLSYYSSLPVFLDEYRNTKELVMKTGFFRNVYNRQSSGKGIKSSFGIREAVIRGTLLLAGEETPADNAMLTRCICLFIKDSNRNHTVNHFNWFTANRIYLSGFTYHVLQRKLNMDIIEEGREYMVKHGVDERTAVNYGIVAGGYHLLFGEDVSFATSLAKYANIAQSTFTREQITNVFLDDIVFLHSRGQIPITYFIEEDDNIYFYFHGIYNLWAEQFRKIRGTEPFKPQAVRDYLGQEQGFIAHDVIKRIKDKRFRCTVFNSDAAPESLKLLFSKDVEQKEWTE